MSESPGGGKPSYIGDTSRDREGDPKPMLIFGLVGTWHAVHRCS